MTSPATFSRSVSILGLPLSSNRKAELRVLVAVKDELLGQQISEVLRSEGSAVERETDALGTLSRLAAKRRGSVDLLIIDVSFNPWIGQALLRAAFGEDWSLPVVLITDREIDLRGGAELWRMGVRAIWKRPIDPETIRGSVSAVYLARRERV